jgi:Caulimovirus viroplasmin
MTNCKEKHYAVAVGRGEPQVYSSWEQARQQVDHHPGNVHQRFDTASEAAQFIAQNAPQQQSQNVASSEHRGTNSQGNNYHSNYQSSQGMLPSSLAFFVNTQVFTLSVASPARCWSSRRSNHSRMPLLFTHVLPFEPALPTNARVGELPLLEL